MRVLVEQSWRDGMAIDARERRLAAEKVVGHLMIDVHAGERFAALLAKEHFEQPQQELMPRLW